MDRGSTREVPGHASPHEGVKTGTDPLLAAILEGLDDAVFVKDPAGRYLWVNGACATLLGADRNVVPGRSDAELLDAGTAAVRGAADATLLRGESQLERQQEQITQQGRTRTLLTTRFPWMTAEGAVQGVIGISRDVTEQRMGEAALRESEARFRLLADTAPVLMWTSDAAGEFDYFNQAWLRFTGKPAGEQLGSGWLDLVHPADRDTIARIIRDALDDPCPFRIEYRLRHRTGDYHWILDAVAPRFTESGEFMGLVGSCTDIHDAVLQQHAVEQSAEELSKLTDELETTVRELRRRTTEAEAARDRAQLTERHARFLDDTTRALQTTLDPHAAMQSVADLAVPGIADRCIVHLVNGAHTRIDSSAGAPDDAKVAELARHYALLSGAGPESVVRTGEPEVYPEMTAEMLRAAAIDEEHFRLLQKCGIRSAMVVPMQARGRTLGAISLLSVESGRIYTEADLPLAEELARRAAIAVDNAQLFRRAEDASRAKSEFLATMSHELRTPLNAISGYTDLLQLGVSDDRAHRHHLERIKASTWQLLSMIEEILTFSRLEAGKADVHPEFVQAQQLVREAADLLEPAIRQKGLELRLLMPETPPLTLTSDRPKIRQILMNLLSNAVKFTDEGSVTVHLEAAEPDMVFQVNDTGCGIRPEQMDRIFEPFWQADSGPTRQRGGTGIGLAVAWRLAELLGGRLEAESTHGSGSTFTLRVPLHQPQA